MHVPIELVLLKSTTVFPHEQSEVTGVVDGLVTDVVVT